MASSVPVLPESIVTASCPCGQAELGQPIGHQSPLWKDGWIVYLVNDAHALQVPRAPVGGRRRAESRGETITTSKHILM